MRLAQEFLREPQFLSLSSDHVHVTDTEHVFYNVPGMDKDRALVRLIEVENPSLGHHLLQHQGQGPLCDGSLAALWL
jgi:superfamily II DNA/RNA helicase